MERKIGEIFEFEGKKLKVVEYSFILHGNGCEVCFFRNKECSKMKCTENEIIFVEVKED